MVGLDDLPDSLLNVLKTLVLAGGGVGAMIGWYVLAQSLGVLSMIIYTVLFLLGSVGVVVFVAFMGPSMPGFTRSLLGDLNTVLMMMGAGIGVMCQADDGTWTLRVARDNGGQLQVYYDGQWRDVAKREHLSRLGMRPFGVCREKTAQTWKEYREDPEVLSDGGLGRKRAQIEARPSVTSNTDSWLLDFTPIISRLESVGGIEIIDRAAEQEMRNQADGSTGGVIAKMLIVLVATLMGAVFGLLLTGAV